jgi:hypothetical protein
MKQQKQSFCAPKVKNFCVQQKSEIFRLHKMEDIL